MFSYLKSFQSKYRTFLKKLIRLFTITFFTFIYLFNVHAESGISREYDIKTAFIYNFAKFIDWPDNSFINAEAPLSICILGKDPFQSTIDSLTKKRIKGREITVKRLNNINNKDKCQILFVSKSEENQLDRLLDILSNENVLTVSDIDGFAVKGGMINLVNHNNKIRFEINIKSVKQTEIRMSSKLLYLAVKTYE